MYNIALWVDGACLNNGGENPSGGYGFVVVLNDKLFCKHSSSIEYEKITNNVAELMAIIRALEWLREWIIEYEEDEPNCINIYSDSAYIVNCINQKWYEKWARNGWITSNKTPVENQELWRKLLEYSQSFPLVQFIKVQGHSGNEFNEMADKLATDAARGGKR